MTMVPARAALPPRYTGLALGYRVLNLDGAEVTPFTTDGVIETAPGHYWVAGGIDGPSLGGLIVWGTKERPNLVQAEIAPLPPVIDPTPAIAALGDRIAELIASLPQPVAIAEIDTDGLQEAIAGIRGQIDALAQNDDATAPVLERLETLRAAIVGDERFEAMRQQMATIGEAIAAIEPPVITTYPPADLSPIAERLVVLGADLARVEALVQPQAPAPPDVSGEIAALEQLLEAAAANHKERVLAPIVARLEQEVERAFRVQGQRFVRSLGSLRSRFTESSYHPYTGTVRLRETLTSDDWLRLFDEATGATTEIFFGAVQSAARAALTAGAQNAIADVGIDSAFTLRNPRAVAYLQAHGYGLISQIDSVTRGNIATIIGEGVREGWSYNEVAREISRLYSQMAVGRPQQHIESRAHLIAVTEAGQAYEAGNEMVVRDLQDAGLRMEKKWLTVGDDRVSTGCRANEAEGWIPLERSHRSGDMRPLRFPGCRCTELYQRARSSSATVADPVLPAPGLPYRAPQDTLANIVSLQDRALGRLAPLAGVTPEAFIADMERGFQRLVANHDMAIQFSSEHMDLFLSDPRFKTQFETNTSGGTNNQDLRANAEANGLGIPRDIDPKLRPVYGYMNLSERARRATAQYGDLTFILRDEVRNRTTVTVEDSLSNFTGRQVAGTPIANPTREGADGFMGILREYAQTGDVNVILDEVAYVEIQVQGGVGIADVRGVIDDKGRLTAAQRQRLSELGVTVWDKAP